MGLDMATEHAEQIDPRALRDSLGRFATGVTVVTTRGEQGAPVGMTVNSFASVSLDPPLVLWSIGLRSPSLAAFRASPGFAVNVLGAGSRALAMQFARPAEDKFAGVAWSEGQHGAPILDDAIASFECLTAQRIAGGDHEIYLGSVVRHEHSDAEPLLFHAGRFCVRAELS